MWNLELVKHWGYLLILLVFGLLSACSDEEFAREGASPGTTSSDSGITIGGLTTVGVLDLGVSNLSAGGSTSVTAVLRNTDGLLYPGSAGVVFTSTCTAFGRATLTTPIITNTGVAISTYAAQGCSGPDLITASVSVNGTIITAAATVTVAPAVLGSVQFISTSAKLIALQGTGGAGLTEFATVVFKVVDETGGPISGETVTFSLSTSVGGLTIRPSSGITGVDGIVQTVVQSGTVATPVRVAATITVGGITVGTQSDKMVISTGIPDQNSFSLSADILNPEGLDFDGEIVEITALVADRFNNWVPDGTSVYFTTEGGQIESSCETLDGGCTVEWRSSNPRPCGNQISGLTVALDPSLGPNQCTASGGTNPITSQSQFSSATPFIAPFGGRATVTAMTIGEESYIDANSNGVFDNPDTFTDLVAEAFRDDDEDGIRDAPHEFYWDFNSNGAHDSTPDGFFNGILCQDTTIPTSRCSTTNTLLHVRDDLVLVMSGSAIFMGFFDDVNRLIQRTPITLVRSQQRRVFVLASDIHNQVPPFGSVVTVTTTLGTIEGEGKSFKVPSTSANNPIHFDFTIVGDRTITSTETGTITIKLITPNGVTSSDTFTFTNTP